MDWFLYDNVLRHERVKYFCGNIAAYDTNIDFPTIFKKLTVQSV